MHNKEIINKISGTKMLALHELKPLQPDNLKSMSKENFGKLTKSLITNDFIAGFYVWENEGDYWILDGHHRKHALESLKQAGHTIPELYPCILVKASTKTDALKLLLTYSSEYAHIDREGISEFIYTNELDFEELSSFLDLRSINLEQIKLDNIELPDIEEPEKSDKHIKCPDCGYEFEYERK